MTQSINSAPDRHPSAPLRNLSNRGVITLCMLVVVMDGYNLISFGVAVPLLLGDAGLAADQQTIGFLGGLVYAGGLLGILGGIPLAERWGRHRVMTLAVGLFALGSALAATATTAEFLGTARLITGVGTGVAFTMALTLARNHAPLNRASLVITITTAGVPLGGTLAALFGIYVMPLWGWRSVFWAGVALTLVILLVSASCRISEPAEIRGSSLTPGQKFTGLFRQRGWILVLFVALASVTNLVTWLGLNVWLAETMKNLGFSLTEALVFTFVLTGAAVTGSWFTATAADRLGSAKIGILCAALTLVGLLGVLLGPASMGLALVFVALMGIGGHSTQNLITATATNDVAPHSRGAILGITNAMAYIGSFLGPVLGGIVFASEGPTGIFSLYSVSATLCLLMCVGLYMAHRSIPRVPQENEGNPPSSSLSRPPVSATVEK